MDDKAIIRLMQSGRPEKGLHEAIRKYEGILTAVASRVLRGSAQDVEECVSDTFVAVWKHIGALDPDSGSLKGYLICTARNLAINRYHQLKRNSVVVLTDELSEIVSEQDIETLVLDAEDTGVLLELIGEMEEPDREILKRKHFLCEPVKSIARRLDLEPNQVTYKLHKAKTTLREALVKRGIAI